MRRTSGVITLPASGPSHLVGSLLSGIDDAGIGWVQASFFQDDDYLKLEERGEQTSLTIRRELMETILGALIILLAANRWMQHAEPRPTPSEKCENFAVDIGVAGKQKPGVVRCSWRTDMEGIERSYVDDQVNLRLREDLAQELANQLGRELGRVAAAIGEQSC